MEKVRISVDQIVIPTYPQPPAEDWPMFAENRVHQRSSGNPYPNKVVMRVDRSQKVDRLYTVVTLENEYVKIEILPEIGGRIYSAYDKTTGYDFFYKQHVIKPALIGVLGSWISGGVEFNWPFHHRASGFMPCDFTTEKADDGTAICWLSEHDPIDRMKGMVGIVLKPGEKCFETRMRLYNRTAAAHPFLWWENAAVPVNEHYQIFFPQDVSYVNFHYLKSRTTYPVAGHTVYNGIPMEADRDISWHKNTREATSYFSAASDYDFFGGYDHGRQCGVVHIGDHHISPGKKMFTWGYNQLASSWENALTDTDGPYAELMAGSYSDNQPNFAWLAPYETKRFSQYWYPISRLGIPTFANLNCAFRLVRETKNQLRIQPTRKYPDARIRVFDRDRVYLDTVAALLPEACAEFETEPLSDYVTVQVTAGGRIIAEYTERPFDRYNMPEPISDMPSAAEMNNAQTLYLAGVHVDQYRDPSTKPDAYWKEALKRDMDHIPSLIAMANYECSRYDFEKAESYAVRAIRALNTFNAHPQSGEAYYVYGRILEATGRIDSAYDRYYQASWAADCVSRAMTRIALIDIRRGDYENAVCHAQNALDSNRCDSLAAAALVLAERERGNPEKAVAVAAQRLSEDCIDHMMRFLSNADHFYNAMESDAAQTCLDLAEDLDAMGRYGDIVRLLTNLVLSRPACECKMVRYILGYAKFRMGLDGTEEYQRAVDAPLGIAYPIRLTELCALRDAVARTGSGDAKTLLGCLLYHKMHVKEAAEQWEACGDDLSCRNLAVAYFSHLNRADDARKIMKSLAEKHPEDEELLYETVCLMDKTGTDPHEKLELLCARRIARDDVLTELAKAYNQAFMPDEAIRTLLSHKFVPCEGGEHAIADQYMFAYLVKGKMALEAGDPEKALECFRTGQILPQTLGAGIWHHCKRIPLKYHEALCLEQMGEKAKADEIFRYITGTKVEYFSNMHLKELPYFQALSHLHLNEALRGRQLITQYLREWKKIGDGKDSGFFSTTPFFIPFVDAPKKLRRAQYLYLTGLCESYMGNREKAVDNMRASLKLNGDYMMTHFFARFMK